MTLAAAILAFTGTVKDPNWVYPVSGCFPVVIFWIMDAVYLRLGRLFRHLFNAVRNHEVEEPFLMEIAKYKKDEQSVLGVALSWSICWYYLSILAAFATVSVHFLRKTD